MLTTILNLNKRVLVVDYKSKEDLETNWVFNESFNFPKAIINGHFCKAICKGEDFTEEIAEELSKIVRNSHNEQGFIHYKYEQDEIVYDPAFINAKNSFISAIEASGHYWLVNPYEDYKPQTIEHYKEWEKLFQEAESKTFKNPILFEIL